MRSCSGVFDKRLVRDIHLAQHNGSQFVHPTSSTPQHLGGAPSRGLVIYVSAVGRSLDGVIPLKRDVRLRNQRMVNHSPKSGVRLRSHDLRFRVGGSSSNTPLTGIPDVSRAKASSMANTASSEKPTTNRGLFTCCKLGLLTNNCLARWARVYRPALCT